MPQYAMITETGLNQIDNAHPLGQYIEIAYYVPVYDYRIDPNILPTDSSISGTEVSSCTNSADEVPQGEVLWNTSGDYYSLSPEQLYLVRTGDETVATSGSNKMITNFAHRNAFNINQFKTSAIGNYYTADTVSSPGSTGFAWFLSNAGYGLLSTPTSAEGYGPEDLDNPESCYLYKGVTYQHVITSANDSRANFKVTIRAQNGQIKFNKIGLYAVKRTADGVIASDPFLFGQVIIPEPQLLYSKDVGSTGKVTEITLDFQIESKTVASGVFDNVFYSTSGDYWVRTTNEENGNYGLTYDGSVYITNTLGIDETGAVLGGDDDRSVSKLLVGTFEYVNKPVTSAEKEMPQLCLQYVASQGIESKRIRTTMRTNVSGDCEFDMYGACLSAHPDNYSLIPVFDKEYGLGLRDKKWSHLYLSDTLRMFDDTWDNVTSGSDFSDSYLNFNMNEKLTHFGNTDIYIGPYHNTKKIVTINNSKYVDKQKNKNYVYGNISSYIASATDYEGTYEHGYDLLVRSLNDIVMVTLSAGNKDSFTAEDIIERIWQTRDVTETNINNNISIIDDKNKRIKTLRTLIANDPTNSNNWKYRREIFSLLNDISKLEAQNKEFSESIIPYLGEDKDILLVAGRNIQTHGDILPLRNLSDSLGWWDNQFANIYGQNFVGWDRDDGNGRNITVQSNITPNGIGFRIRENTWDFSDEPGDWQWEEITAKEFGRSDRYVERGYISRIDTEHIKLNGGGLIDFENGLKIDKSSIYTDNQYFSNIGTYEDRVGTIYVDNLVLTNQGEVTPINFYREFTSPYVDVWDKMKSQKNNTTVFVKMKLIKTTDVLSNSIIVEGEIQARGRATEYIRKSEWPSNRIIFTVNSIKEILKVNSSRTVSLVVPSGNIVTTEYKNSNIYYNNTGSITYSNSDDKLYIKQSNNYSHQKNNNYWVGWDNTVKIKFVIN